MRLRAGLLLALAFACALPPAGFESPEERAARGHPIGRERGFRSGALGYRLDDLSQSDAGVLVVLQLYNGRRRDIAGGVLRLILRGGSYQLCSAQVGLRAIRSRGSESLVASLPPAPFEVRGVDLELLALRD